MPAHLYEARKLIARLKPVIDELTAPDNLRGMQVSTMYTREVPELPNTEVFVLYEGHHYVLGLQISCRLGIDQESLERITLAASADWFVQPTIRDDSANGFYLLRYWRVLTSEATAKKPFLGILEKPR